VHFTEHLDNTTEDPIDPTRVITMLERDIFLAGYYIIRLLHWALAPVGFALNVQ
jgi:hypothetical protein